MSTTINTSIWKISIDDFLLDCDQPPINRSIIPQIRDQEKIRVHNLLERKLGEAYYNAIKIYLRDHDSIQTISDIQEVYFIYVAERLKRSRLQTTNKKTVVVEPVEEEADQPRAYTITINVETVIYETYTCLMTISGFPPDMTVSNLERAVQNAEFENIRYDESRGDESVLLNSSIHGSFFRNVKHTILDGIKESM